VAEGTTVRVRVAPRASRDELAGERDGALVVRLTAPPVDGEANAALMRFLARRLRVPPSSVTVAQGARGREKVVLVSGARADDVRARLSTAPRGKGAAGPAR
jgi:uncharacterized protein (TIGR00251 family)